MHTFGRLLTVILLALLLPCTPLPAASSPPGDAADPGWPRLLEAGGKRLTIYQPQIDSWPDYKEIHFRCAIAVLDRGAKEERFGVLEVAARTTVDHRGGRGKLDKLLSGKSATRNALRWA